MSSESGSRRRPASRAVKPSTDWRYWVTRNIWPNMAKNMSVIATLAAEKRGFLKNRRSSMGWLDRCSHTKKMVITTAPITSAAITTGSLQPLMGASMIAHRTAIRPTIERPEPTRSSWRALESREVGSRRRPATRVTMTTGTLIRNTACHEKCWRSQPPRTGPNPLLALATAAHTPIARARSRGSGKMVLMSDSVAGMISAAPMPIIARHTVSWSESWARPDSSEPTPNTARPAMRAPRRPNRSPRAPIVRSRPANTMV
jgi:hypothetical protein